ncbi:MAG: hypothetical protein CM1200mP16_13450 [Nitrospina sp.]|nr:MAG: hypothetical protein CM1200mP16_13450 [Nitrospina sp.]
MAIRLFYERELVTQACQKQLGNFWPYDSIIECLNNHPPVTALFKEFRGGASDDAVDNLKYPRLLRVL